MEGKSAALRGRSSSRELAKRRAARREGSSISDGEVPKQKQSGQREGCGGLEKGTRKKEVDTASSVECGQRDFLERGERKPIRSRWEQMTTRALHVEGPSSGYRE